jgi:hypothetical protein
MGELACRTHIGGRGTARRVGERITDGPVQSRKEPPRRLTRAAKIGPAGLDNETYVIGQNLFEMAWDRCTYKLLSGYGMIHKFFGK